MPRYSLFLIYLYFSQCTIFKQLVAKSSYFVVHKFIKNNEDAFDLVQDSYLTAFERLHQLENSKQFWSWLDMIVANKCRDYLKKKRPVLFSEMQLEDGSDLDWEDERTELMPDLQLDSKETERLRREIVDDLPMEQRLCVLLHYQQLNKSALYFGRTKSHPHTLF